MVEAGPYDRGSEAGCRMKVVQIVNSLSTGGAESFVSQLAAALQKRCEVQVWTYAGAIDQGGRAMQRDLESAGVRVRSLNMSSRLVKTLVPCYWRRWIAAERPDIVNVHLDQSELLTGAAIQGMRRRPALVRTLHNTQVLVWSARVFRSWLDRAFDFTIACSDPILPRITRGPARMVPCGIRVPPGIDQTERPAIRQMLALPADKIILLCIGGMNLRSGKLAKAQDRILRAFAASGLQGTATVVFVGGGSERRRLEQLAADLGVTASVRFAGEVLPKEKWDYIAACDGGLLLSRFEGLPLAGMEFGCAGRAMLLSDIPELSAFANPASVVAAEDSVPENMRTFVDRLPALTLEARQRKGYYRSKYSIEASAAAYYDVYVDILQARREYKSLSAGISIR